MNKNQFICWSFVIIWAEFIFLLSNMNTDESNRKSKNTINKAMEKTVQATNKLGITNKYPNENKMKQVIEKLNRPVRKIAHASEYFVLTILIINALFKCNIN